MYIHPFMPSGTQGAWWYSGCLVVLGVPGGTQEVIKMQQTKNRIHSSIISARTDRELWFKCREKTGR